MKQRELTVPFVDYLEFKEAQGVVPRPSRFIWLIKESVFKTVEMSLTEWLQYAINNNWSDEVIIDFVKEYEAYLYFNDNLPTNPPILTLIDPVDCIIDDPIEFETERMKHDSCVYNGPIIFGTSRRTGVVCRKISRHERSDFRSSMPRIGNQVYVKSTDEHFWFNGVEWVKMEVA